MAQKGGERGWRRLRTLLTSLPALPCPQIVHRLPTAAAFVKRLGLCGLGSLSTKNLRYYYLSVCVKNNNNTCDVASPRCRNWNLALSWSLFGIIRFFGLEFKGIIVVMWRIESIDDGDQYAYDDGEDLD